MSRYYCGGYAYGYDYPCKEYFLQENKGDRTELVGSLSPKQGTSRNMLETIYRLEIPIPEDHRMSLELDLPF